MIHHIATCTGHSVRLACQCLRLPRSSYYQAAVPTASQLNFLSSIVKSASP